MRVTFQTSSQGIFMNSLPAAEVLGAMITPAVLISAAGTLILSTSNRLSRVVDRVRVLAAEAEQLNGAPPLDPVATDAKRTFIADQLARLSARLVLLRAAMTVLYMAIGLLVATSITVGVVVLLQAGYEWLPVAMGLLGASALLYGSLLLVREARLAVGSSLIEMAFIRPAVAQQANSKTAPHSQQYSG